MLVRTTSFATELQKTFQKEDVMADYRLDDVDKKLLEILQRDGRILNTLLADEVGLTPGPCLKRVKRLEALGIIERYVALLNAKKVARNLLVFVNVTMDKQTQTNLQGFAARIRKHAEVLECHMVLGECDFLLKITALDLDSFQEFLISHITSVSGVSKVVSTVVVKQEKNSTYHPIL
jgi:Lrp/AsnC family transcriptional regulator, leucine-responsive regulatory protein